MRYEGKRKRNIAAALTLALVMTLLCACESGPAVPETRESPDLSEASVTPTPTPTPAPTPTPRPERVEDDFFADAAFFGNSLVDGLRNFGGLAEGEFFAGTSANVISVESTKDARLSDGSAATMLEALLEEDHGKIYVLLGINEIGFDADVFVGLYASLLEKIQADQPQAQIYVMSLTPVTAWRSKADSLFTRDRVRDYNAAIQTMAEAEGYIFLDLFDALSDNEGFLPEDRSTDGVHFTVETYLDWAEYLRLNYDGEAEVTFYKDPDVVFNEEPVPEDLSGPED